MSPLMVAKIERELPILAAMFRVGDVLPSNHACTRLIVPCRDVKGVISIDESTHDCSPDCSIVCNGDGVLIPLRTRR